MTPTKNLTAAATLAILLAIAAGAGYQAGINQMHSASADLVAITQKALRKAKASADSLRQAHAKQLQQDSLSWASYVQQVRTAGHDSLQTALRRLAVRRGNEVAQHIPDSNLHAPFPGDIPSNRDSACTVEMPCTAAADLLAGDSLRTTRIDSLTRAATVASAACSTAVMGERLRGDLLAARPAPRPWWAELRNHAATLATGLGLGAAMTLLSGAAK